MRLKNIISTFVLSLISNLSFISCTTEQRVRPHPLVFGESIDALDYWRKVNTMSKVALEQIDDLICFCQNPDINDIGIITRPTLHQIKIPFWDYYSFANSSDVKALEELEKKDIVSTLSTQEVQGLKKIQEEAEKAQNLEEFFDLLVKADQIVDGVLYCEKFSLASFIMATPSLRKIYKRRTAQKRASRLLVYYVSEFFTDKNYRYIWNKIIKKKKGYQTRFQEKLSKTMNWNQTYINSFFNTNDSEGYAFFGNQITSVAALRSVTEELLLCSAVALEWWQEWAQRLRKNVSVSPIYDMAKEENFLPLKKEKSSSIFPCWFAAPLF